jgi:hypothetical protein
MSGFADNFFALQKIAKGEYIDDGAGDGRSYMVKVIAIRMNHVALNEWILSENLNCRACYETDAEWEAHKTEYSKKRETVKTKIIDLLRLDPNKGSFSITQALAEVFTVVYITKGGGSW